MGRHIYLRQLQDANETLFYRLMLDHVEEMMPIVYTPTVGLACQQFSHIYRRPRGLFVSYALRESIPEILRNRPNPEVDVIVVTDGERILGLGDQGVGGLGIPIGKLSLYSLIGGIHPSRTLPIVLDVGTNNEERLQDPEYLGWRHERVTGQEYRDFVDRFVQAVKQELPDTCLQWEDFATPHARPLLERYQNELLTFNDDVIVDKDGLLDSDRRDLSAEQRTYAGKTIEIAQCNNVFIFPAVGLGLLASSAWRVTDKMMLAGAKALGEQSPALRDPGASLLPSVANIRKVALDVAYGVALQAQGEGLAPVQQAEALRHEVVRSQWSPEYVQYQA